MTERELLDLIQKKESPKLDFKRDYEEKKENADYIADIVSIANGNIDNIGEIGYLIFGIKEHQLSKNEIYGVGTQKNCQEIQRHIAEKLNNHVSPHIMNIEVKDFYFDEKRVIVIKIPFQNSPLILKKDIKNTRYKVFNFLFRIGDGIQVVSEAYYTKIIDDFKEKIENYKIANQIKPSSEVFEPKRKIDDGTYRNQKNKVSLFASLPVLNYYYYKSRLSIECEITFILENSTKIMLSVSEEEVLLSLFSGYKFKLYNENNKRDWIVFFDKTNNLFTIQISSTSLNISYETAKELSEILDDLQEVYASKMNNVEDKLNSKGFPFSQKYKNGFELCQIDQRLWVDIQKFVLKHNRIDNETGAWNIFGDSLYEIDVFNKEDKVHLMFTYSIDENIGFYRAINNPKIVIIWNTLDTHYSRINDIIMSVEESYNWFIHKFIPQVIKETYQDEQIENKSKLFFKKASNPKFKDKSYSIPYNLKADEKDNGLLEIISNLESFFNNKEVAVTKNTLKDLYEGFILLLEKSEKLDFPYLSDKLRSVGNKQRILSEKSQFNFATRKDFIEYIQKELNEIEKGEMSIDDLVSVFTIDHILRCYYITIRDNIDLYGDSFKYDISQKLKGIKEIYDVLKVSRRRLGW